MKIPFPKYNEALVLAIEDELDQVHRTEITACAPMSNWTPGGEAYESYTLLTARGAFRADTDESVTPRMMIQSIPTLPERRSRGMIYTDPCAACDNFAISWKCDEHPELDYDSERHRWIKPGSFDPFATPFEPIAGDPFDEDSRLINEFTGHLDASSTDRERITALGAYLERLAELEVDE